MLLGFQFALNDTKSSYLRTLSGLSKPAFALASSFLEFTVRITPICLCSFKYYWNSL